jgi:hypothetical protein
MSNRDATKRKHFVRKRKASGLGDNVVPFESETVPVAQPLAWIIDVIIE